jgi:hypothetical protein
MLAPRGPVDVYVLGALKNKCSSLGKKMDKRFGYILVLIALAASAARAQQPRVAPPLPQLSVSDARNKELLAHIDERLQSGKVQMVAGSPQKITSSNTPQPALDPAISEALQEQSTQTHLEKTQAFPKVEVAPPSVSGGSRPLTSPGMMVTTSKFGRLAPQTATLAELPCRLEATPEIRSVSGKSKGVVFTPDPGTGQYPNNQYTIYGCNFGDSQGQGEVHIFGPSINHNGPIKLSVDSWSNKLIVVTFDPTFENEYDLSNITLVVVASNGQSAQFPGNSFVARRVSRPLELIPKSAVTLQQTYVKDLAVSPVTSSQLQMAGWNLAPYYLNSQSTDPWAACLVQIDSIWHDYPSTRINWQNTIDFSKLRPGFVLDDSFRTVMVGHTMGENTFSDESCKYYDTVVTCQLQGSALQVSVAPQECDWNGKYAYGIFGLMLSVTGPKGNLLNPWPDNIQ